MKLIILSIYFIMIALLIFCANKAYSKQSKLAKTITALLIVAIITIIVNNITILINNKFFALIMMNVYYLCFDWLTICLLLYTEHYTQNIKKTILGRTITVSLAVIDSISFILNPFIHHIFDIEKIHIVDDLYIWTTINTTIFFTFHLILTYVLVIFTILAFVVKIITVPSLYKKKFITILSFLLIVILLNAIFVFSNIALDISLFLYSALAAVVCYYSLFYKPRSIVNNMLSLVVASMDDSVFCYDLWGNCLYTNSAQTISPNYSGEALSKEIYSRWSKTNPNDARHFISWEHSQIVDNTTRYFNTTYQKIFDKKGIYVGCYFTIYDKTKEVEQFNEAHYKMTHDNLTGLYNREYFFECVAERLKAAPNKRYFMICSNIKGFKLFNELFGTQKGDEVLITQAELIKQYADNNSISGRISGDEFALLIDTGIINEKIFVDLVTAMRKRFNNNLYRLHINIGIYEITNPSEPVSTMCDKCKIAIESFSGDYNNIISHYDGQLLEKSLYERKIVSEFDKSLENSEFKLYLQPQYSTHGNILGAEALVRWHHPLRGIIYPGDFIETFEKTGIIYKLDYYMWELAASKLAEWKERGFNHLYISVNISAKDFYYMNVFKEITSIVTKYDIDPKNLKLEITETVLMTESHSMKLIKKLRDFGFLIEIDDFGSGYSSLNMLKDIDVDVIKIDMGFLRDTQNTKEGRSELILDSIITMIKHLGMEVITEGVETKEQVEMLTKMGCDVFQGYYFSKPLSIEDFEKSLD